MIDKLPDTESIIKDHYLEHLRNIQYYLPNHNYTMTDKKILIINAKYFSRHSKYLVHLIKSISWEQKDEQLQLITNVINSEKTIKCSKLFCTRTCQDQLSCDDCINIMYSHVDNIPSELLEYLFAIIMKTPESVILCHLSFFINLIKENVHNKTIQSHIYNLLSRSTKLIYHTFWFLNNTRINSNYIELTNINNFIDFFNPELVNQMHREYTFFSGLIENLKDPKRYLMTNFHLYTPISVPFDPEIKLLEYEADNIVIKNSYTKPVMITFKTNNGNINLLFKKECIMNDVTVLNLMTLTDIILNETLNTKFDIIVYPVMPLTHDSGMIKIIDSADTVYDITHKNKKTITQHIMERNEDKIIGNVMDKYMYSLVLYTLHSYFLGLGDRHLQNIMITNDGAIFHIDFGFILGSDAYPLTSDIKLNSDMLEVIGGSSGYRYQTYLELCSSGVLIIRKYFNMFFILLHQNTKFKEKYIQKFVMSRFQPRQPDPIIVSELMNIIRQSHNAYSEVFRDFVHTHTQEKTVQLGFGQLLEAAYDTLKSITSSTDK